MKTVVLIFVILNFFNTTIGINIRIPIIGGSLIIRNNSDGSLVFSTDQNLDFDGNGAGKNTSLTFGKDAVDIKDSSAILVNGSQHGLSSSFGSNNETGVHLNSTLLHPNNDDKNSKNKILNSILSIFGG